MSYLSTAVLTVLFTVGFLLIYKFVINPQVVFTPNAKSMAQCPDRWNYNMVSRMCEPGYDTHCMPFDPSAPTLESASSKCNVARSCGTTWSGYCA